MMYLIYSNANICCVSNIYYYIIQLHLKKTLACLFYHTNFINNIFFHYSIYASL